jgi:2-polyprenyl-3-methyl-5-hydroxy-6-metoxy-1,4-benzoquinol methylase
MSDDSFGQDSYQQKPAAYFEGARHDFVALLPADPKAHILEIGCSNGATGVAALKAGKCAHYAGIELMDEAAEKARQVLSQVWVGNVETMDFAMPDASLDAVILSEVLEHLAWPDQVLRRLRPKLKPNALLLASSPNIAHWKVLRELAAGRFDATDIGTMDRTHLRWFTPGSYRRLFEDAGYRVERVWPIRDLRGSKRILATLTRRPWLFWSQICLAARGPAG